MRKNSNHFRKVDINNENVISRNKKEYTKILLLVLFLAVLTIGVSYAFFSVTKTGKENIKIVAGNFKINFYEGQAVTINNAYPMTDEEGKAQEQSYTFSIENEGDLDANYNISLRDVNTTIPYNLIKYSIKEDDGDWGAGTSLASGLNLRVNRLLKAHKTIKYEIKFWIDESAGNDIQGQSFSAKIEVTAVQKTEDNLNSTSPIIKVNADSTIEIEEGENFTPPQIGEILDDKDKIDPSEVSIRYEYFDGVTTIPVDFVDTSRPGIYYIYYSVTDSDGNTTTTVITVIVKSKEHTTGSIPKLTLVGDQVVIVAKDGVYSELGAIATDDEDGDLTNKIVTTGEVDVTTVGVYHIKYVVTDSDNNTSSIARTVIVSSDTSKPENPDKPNEDVDIKVDDKITSDGGEADIPVNVESKNALIIGYYFGLSDKEPSLEEFTEINPPVKTFEYTFSVDEEGEYYLYILDSNHNIFKKKIVVKLEDKIKPVCEFVTSYITSGEQVVDILCTDNSKLPQVNLTADDFSISNPDLARITSISGAIAVENGYKYNLALTVSKISKAENFDITMREGVISDKSGNTNVATTKNIKVVKLTTDHKQLELDLSSNATPVKIEVKGESEKGNLTYVSSDDDIVLVNSEGVLTGKKVGTATITVIDPISKATIAIDVVVNKTLTATYHKNSDTVLSISQLTDENTSCKLTPNNPDSCSITMPDFLVDEESGFKKVGWGISADSTTGVSVNSKNTISDNMVFYAITEKKAITYTINWDGNGSTLEGGEYSCIVEASYNGASQADSCIVQKPTIHGSSNTPVVLGYSYEDPDAHDADIDDQGSLILNSENNGKTYYAITTNTPVTYRAVFRDNGSISTSFSEKEASCTTKKVYNGQVSENSCSLTAPSIEMNDGYEFVGWNTDASAEKGIEKLSISNNDTVFYVITSNISKEITVAFVKNGRGVTGIGANFSTCKTKKVYNPKQPVEDYCEITAPKIDVVDGYKSIGWSTNPDAHSRDEDLYDMVTDLDQDGNQVSREVLKVKENVLYYAISKKPGSTLTAQFNPNGSTIFSEEKTCNREDENCSIEKTCTIDDVYNNEIQEKKCEIQVPTIIRDGYKIIGFGKEKEKSFDDNQTIYLTNEEKEMNSNTFLSGVTWDAITNKTVKVNWYGNGAAINKTKPEEQVEKAESECVIWNKNTSCSVSVPNIKRDGYQVLGWGDSPDSQIANSDIVIGQELSVEDNANFYAITSKEVTVNYFYHESGHIANIHDQTTIYNAEKYPVKIPDEVVQSIGPDDMEYKGVSTSVDHDEVISKDTLITADASYYAVYQKLASTNFYYYQADGQQVQTEYTFIDAVVKNQDDTDYTVRHKDVSIPSVVISSNGIENGSYYGLSKTVESDTLESNITTENKNYYAVYKGTWSIHYTKDLKSVESISGSSLSSCENKQITDGETYSVIGIDCSDKTLPKINLKTGYSNPLWTDLDSNQTYSSEGEYTITGNNVLHASGTINTYTVTYNCESEGVSCGSTPNEQSVHYGDRVPLSFVATKMGYDFLGWNTNKDAEEGLSEIIATENIDLFPIFKKSAEVALNAITPTSYTGIPIVANEAAIINGTAKELTYKYYTDSSCSKEIPTEMGASEVGGAPIDAGNYYVKATALTTEDRTVHSNCITHTILKQNLNVLWKEDSTFIYDGKTHVRALQDTHLTGVNDEIVNLEVSGEKVNVGTYQAIASIANVSGGRGKAANYDLVNNSGDFRIDPFIPELELSEQEVVIPYGKFNEKTFEVTKNTGGVLSVSSNYDGVVTSLSDNTVTVSNLKDIPAGITINITVTSAGTENSYAQSVPYIIKITKASIDVPKCQVNTYTGFAQKLYNSTSEYIAVGLDEAVNVGNYDSMLLPTNNYQWSDGTVLPKTITCSISPKSISSDDIHVIIDKDSYVYDGNEKTPTVTVKDTKRDVTLIKDEDYIVKYESNINAGDAKVIIEGKNNYSEEQEKQFTITRKKIAVPTCEDKTYNRSSQVLFSDTEEYTAGGETVGTNAKTYHVTAKPTSNYQWNDVDETSPESTRSRTIDCRIKRKSVLSEDIRITLSNYTYTYDDGNEIRPGVTVQDGDVTLIEDEDYSLSYGMNVNVGKADAIITGKGNYDYQAIESFIINRKSILPPVCNSVTYNGNSQTLINQNNDRYTVRNSDGIDNAQAVNAGSYTYFVSPTSNYQWDDDTITDKTLNCSISPKRMDASDSGITVSLSSTSYTYDGNAKTPTVTVKDTARNNVVLSKDTDYTLSYSNNINAGTAKVTVTGKGNYTNAKQTTYTINKATPTLTLSSTSSSMYFGEKNSVTFTATSSSGGALSVTDDSSAATSSVNSNTVTLSNLSNTGVGTVKVTVMTAATTNYNSKTATYTLTINGRKIILNFSKGSHIESISNSKLEYTTTGTETSHTFVLPTMKADEAGGWYHSHWRDSTSGSTYGPSQAVTYTAKKQQTTTYNLTSVARDVQAPQVKYVANSFNSQAFNMCVDTSYRIRGEIAVTDNSGIIHGIVSYSVPVNIGTVEIRDSITNGSHYDLVLQIPSSNTTTGDVSISIPICMFRDTAGNCSSGLTINPFVSIYDRKTCEEYRFYGS